MAGLTDEHRRFIVESLACYDTPAMIIADLKEQYDVVATPQQIAYYNPKSAQAKQQLSQEWKDLFDARRKEFDNEVETIPIARKAVRLRRLQRIINSAKADKMPVIVMNAMKQVAMEVGGMFERQEKLDPKDLTDEQIIRILEGKVKGGGQASETGDPGA